MLGFEELGKLWSELLTLWNGSEDHALSQPPACYTMPIPKAKLLFDYNLMQQTV